MLNRVILLALLAATGLVDAGFLRGPHVPASALFERGALISRQAKGKQTGNNNNNNNNGACLAQNVRQAASNTDGQETGTEGIKAGQAKSTKDANNFINFCSGQTITNGKQIKTGSCNPTPMGQLPAQAKMISAIITNPKPGDKLTSGQTFKIDVQTRNLQAGTFTNPTVTYYTAPQTLNAQGQVIGHCHVTVQKIDSLTSTNPPDAATFAFFKGIDDAGNGQGLLSATVDGGLPAGTYRVCTIIAAANHQPVAMPIAQRGAQDDCTKFEVAAAGGGNNNNNNNNNANNKGAANQGANKQGQQAKKQRARSTRI